MNLRNLVILPLLLVAVSTFAQNNPPRPNGPGRGGPPDRPRDDGGGGGGGGGFDGAPFVDGRGPGPGAGPGRGQGPGNPLMMQVELMRNWLDLIDRYARLSRDPVSAGVAAVVSADDLLRGKPPEEAIEFFNKMLEETKNETVKRAIRLQLAELHGKAHQPDKALEHLRKLMVDAPDAPPPPPAGGPTPATPKP